MMLPSSAPVPTVVTITCASRAGQAAGRQILSDTMYGTVQNSACVYTRTDHSNGVIRHAQCRTGTCNLHDASQ